jgi:hypothetical protein
MRVGAAFAGVVAGLDGRIYVISGFDKDLQGNRANSPT